MIEISIKIEKVNHLSSSEDIGMAVTMQQRHPTLIELDIGRTVMIALPAFLGMISKIHGSGGAIMGVGPDMETLKAEIISRLQNRRDAAG